jgi:hypothetical protein
MLCAGLIVLGLGGAWWAQSQEDVDEIRRYFGKPFH